MNTIKKVVLAYSGGLDTSVILRWLQKNYQCEVITFTADIGQGEELESAKQKAHALGVKQIFIENLCEPLAKEYIFPMFRANAIYEGEYLLGTSIARPIVAKRLAEIALETGADAVAHGATGKGNDQLRFELGVCALVPELKIIAPWREWKFDSRKSMLDFAQANDIPIDFQKQSGNSPYSMDANLLHISYEGNELEDPWTTPANSMWRWTVSPKDAPDQEEVIEITFEKGDAVAINHQPHTPAEIFFKLNKLGGKHGIGRNDLVENRAVGMKSRGCYETPGGTILLRAHRAIESITLDREAMHLKDELMPRYAKIIYNGYWFSPEREMLQAAIDHSQRSVSGVVKLKLYKGGIEILGRKSPNSLFDPEVATFEADHGKYDQQDAGGFIRLSGLRLKTGYKQFSNNH